jgi:hypothetical protein
MSAQTLEGARKWKETMAKKHGSYEKYRSVARQNASKGGKHGHTIGWAHGKADPKESGRKGGFKSSIIK